MNGTPTVSVILPVYNVEAYLRECLDSIRRQTFGDFELICIDDGSTDSSGAILDAVARRDPRLRVFHQPNGGVSQARNRGLSLARGEYLYLCDPDDLCHRRLLETLVRKARADRSEIVCCQRASFDCISGKPMGRMTFPEWVWDVPCPFAGISQPRRLMAAFGSSTCDKLLLRRFVEDNGLRYQEDVRRFALYYFTTMALVLAKRISVVPDCLYFYRENRPGSLQQTREASPLDVVRSRRSIAGELKRRGLFEKFELGFMMSLVRVGKSQLEGTRLPENRARCFEALKAFGREVVSRPGFPIMEFATSPEYADWRRIETADGPGPYREPSGLRLFDMASPFRLAVRERWRRFCGVWRRRAGKVAQPSLVQSGLRLQLNFLRFRDGELLLEGRAFSDRADAEEVFRSLSLVACLGSGECRCALSDGARALSETPDYGTAVKAWDFSCRFPWQPGSRASFRWVSSHADVRPSWHQLEYTRYSPLTNLLRFSYAEVGGSLFSFSGDELLARPSGFLAWLRAESLLCLNLLKKRSRVALKALLLRWFVRMNRRFRRRPIWLFSDRVDRADDNGRALFEYVASRPPSERPPSCVFAISSRASEVGELKRFGKVVDIESFRYKLAFLLSDFVISAQHTPQNRFPFDGLFAHYAKDLVLRPRFILLRHGVCQNDTSLIQNRYWDNASLMLTVSEKERASMLAPSYGYTPREVRTLGFPRYDLLRNEPKKIVTFMPTWRPSLIEWDELGRHRPSETAAESRFVRTYSKVLSESSLIAACARQGYSIQVMPHPNLRSVLPLLKMDSSVRILPEDTPYRQVFAESNLVITDYSSTAFDFAYLHKPVVYFQFDRDEFFGPIYRPGYFDCRRDGFGPVCDTADELVRTLLRLVETDCRMDPVYDGRVSSFFAHTDTGNCRRVYDAIMNLSEG